MSTPREIRTARRARRSDPWAPTVKGDLDELPLIEWRPSLPVGEATELSFEDGLAQFRLAERLRENQ